MSLLSPHPRPEIVDKTGKLLTQWNVWFSLIYNLFLVTVGQTGTTAARPTTNLWVGQMYFDSTLGYPVYVKSLNPTVWVNGAGSVV